MGMTTEGLDHNQDAALTGATQVDPWYIGLISDTNYSALDAGDTLASHAGWEESTAYAGDRKEWTEGASSGGVVTNPSTVNFVMNANVTIKGMFLCSVPTGTSGVLYGTVLFSGGDAVLTNGQTFHVIATSTAS